MSASPLLEPIHRKLKSLYTGPARRVAIETGLHSFIRDIYGRVIVHFTDNVQTQEIAGVTVQYRTEIYSDWERQRSFKGEQPVMEQFVADVTDGDTVWDVGANMGTYTCLAGRAADDVSVVAFEPAPENRERLKRNVALNGVEATVRQEALDEATGEMGLSSGSTGDGQYALTDERDGLQISTVEADSLVSQNVVSCPSTVKIDVEGAELRVLRGMETILEEVENLYIEVHPSRVKEYGGSTDELESRITDAGLQYKRIHERGNQYFLRAVRR
jgi:FkbM family methyltransferase